MVLLGSAPVVEMWIRTVLAIRRLRVVEPADAATTTRSPGTGRTRFVYLIARRCCSWSSSRWPRPGWAVPMLVLAAAYGRVPGSAARPRPAAGAGQPAGRGPAAERRWRSTARSSPSTSPPTSRRSTRWPCGCRTSSGSGGGSSSSPGPAATVPAIAGADRRARSCCAARCASLDATITPGLTTVFYVNNGLKNTHYIERRELAHIWLNHGDSEKPACFNPVHAIYDRIFAAGQAGIDRYARHGVTSRRRSSRSSGVRRSRRSRCAPAPPAAEPARRRSSTRRPGSGRSRTSDVYSLPVGDGDRRRAAGPRLPRWCSGPTR